LELTGPLRGQRVEWSRVCRVKVQGEAIVLELNQRDWLGRRQILALRPRERLNEVAKILGATCVIV